MTEKIHTIVLEDEFRTCPICDYHDGFHTMLQRDKAKDLVLWLFICPSCHEIFDIGQTV